MIYRQDIRHLGETLKSKKSWRKGLMVGGKAAEIVGGGLALASPLAGPLAPEVLAAGSALGLGGRRAENLSKLLK